MASTAPHHVQATPPTATGSADVLTWLTRAVPTALVVSALVGVAAWGHFADWKIPTFSSLVGGPQEAAEVWCQAHNVPEAECIECNLALVPPVNDFGWCKEHGVAQCPLEHPEVAQVKASP